MVGHNGADMVVVGRALFQEPKTLQSRAERVIARPRKKVR